MDACGQSISESEHPHPPRPGPPDIRRIDRPTTTSSRATRRRPLRGNRRRDTASPNGDAERGVARPGLPAGRGRARNAAVCAGERRTSHRRGDGCGRRKTRAISSAPNFDAGADIQFQSTGAKCHAFDGERPEERDAIEVGFGIRDAGDGDPPRCGGGNERDTRVFRPRSSRPERARTSRRRSPRRGSHRGNLARRSATYVRTLYIAPHRGAECSRFHRVGICDDVGPPPGA
mmetsp:Transcript_12493/g.22602  ORF Transcript_12493/g.22602 Transcript_12493/m.22602 type:complete len:232 (-) Transcript_12493:451-1146(-)